MPPEFTIKKYNINGININVAEAGSGKPLVFIHGWTNNWRGWTLLAQELAPFYSLYLLDLPGFGDSDRLNKYSVDIVTDIVVSFIQNYIKQPHAIIGASLGTIVCANILTKYPKLSENIILAGAVLKKLSTRKAAYVYKKILRNSNKYALTQELLTLGVKNTLIAYAVERFLNSYKFDKKLVDKYGLPGRKKITARSYTQLGVSAMEFCMEDFLVHSQHNILLLYGEKEKYVRPQYIANLLESWKRPNITMHVVAKAGHNLAYERPAETALLIKNFLEKRT